MDFPIISLIHSIDPNQQSKGNLYLGGFKATKKEILDEKQINAVVTIISEYEVKIDQQKSHLVIKILDKQEENIISYFNESFLFIEEYLNKTNVLIHCAYGVSRSASITIAFLMKFQNQTFWEGIVLILMMDFKNNYQNIKNCQKLNNEVKVSEKDKYQNQINFKSHQTQSYIFFQIQMEESQNIQVVLRVRPLNQREKQEESDVCIMINDDQSVLVQCKPIQKRFSFDYVANEDCSNEDFFYQSGGMQMSEQCVEGFNGCLFAYGQTGSGKTHTMVGELSLQITDQTGLQPRVIQHLLTLIRRQSKSIGSFYCARCSFLEIYNENIIDLLNPGDKTLKIRQDLKKGIFVENLTEEEVVTFDEVQQIMLKGNRNRKCAPTLMNAQSSRSHSIFQLSLESKITKDGISVIKTSKINFVDLAGSERQNKTGAEGDRLKEANCINKSLLQLGTVISTLIKSANTILHIPYRNSKLTHFLQDSLGGNSKTVMIAAVSPASTQIFETLSTLNFTQCVKLVKNQAKVNEKLGGVEVQRLEKEITQLRNELQRYKNMQEKENVSLSKNLQLNSDLKVYIEKKFIRPLRFK